MRGGWFKCLAAAWEQVRGRVPKPWTYECMVADVRWWNDQLKIGRPATLPIYEELAAQWYVFLDEVHQICNEVSSEGQRKPSRKPPRTPASRGLSDQTTDQTTYSESVSGEAGMGTHEPKTVPKEPAPELVALMAHLKREIPSDH